MKKINFYRCKLFSFYRGNGLFWFRIFNVGLSFKHINNYYFTIEEEKDPKGLFFYYWLISFIK